MIKMFYREKKYASKNIMIKRIEHISFDFYGKYEFLFYEIIF